MRKYFERLRNMKKEFNYNRNITISLIFIICLMAPTIFVRGEISSSIIDVLESKSFIFEIEESNGELFFYPAGMVQIEENGRINLTYTGQYEEWGIKDLFFDIEFIKADGTVNSTVKNISQSSIGMGLIWGFGGFSPNFVCSTNWTENDANARMVADAPPDQTWPSLNGTLKIESKSGIHTYDYVQNPANGSQTSKLIYDEETGILQEFDCSYGDYYMKAILENNSNGINGFSSIFVIYCLFISSMILIKRKFR